MSGSHMITPSQLMCQIGLPDAPYTHKDEKCSLTPFWTGLIYGQTR